MPLKIRVYARHILWLICIYRYTATFLNLHGGRRQAILTLIPISLHTYNSYPISAKGSGKDPVHSLRVKSEFRDGCQQHGTAAYAGLSPPHILGFGPVSGYPVTERDSYGAENIVKAASDSSIHNQSPIPHIPCTIPRSLHTDTYVNQHGLHSNPP